MRSLNPILPFLLLLLISGVSVAQSGGSAIVAEKADVSITLYPNPASDFITIKLSEIKAADTKIILYNIIGNEVQAETETIDEHEIRVRVKELSAGYYLLAIRDDQIKFRGTYKFLKR
jgi:hypothetical protein